MEETENQEVSDVEKMFENISAESDKKTRSVRRNLYHEENHQLCDVLDTLHDEYKKDCIVTYANVGDMVMKVPAIKQKWVSRFCRYRNGLADVERQLKLETEAEIQKTIKESPVSITRIAAQKAVMASNSNKKIVLLTERAELLKRINDDLSEILKHVHFLNTEIGAIVDYLKMENS